jgi:NAD-dependent deacetylase
MIDISDSLSALLRGRVLVVTGSGVSAESGVPTFRGAGGYWRNHDPMQLATQAAFDRDPLLVWEWYGERRQTIRAARPNAAHDALVRLGKIAREFLLVTQNVDDLHERAGTPADRLVHIHGEIFVSRCSNSHCSYQTREDLPSDALVHCQRERCRAPLRPGVVWFGESLDPRQIARVERFFADGPVDLVMAIGTTALFGYIIHWATSGAHLVEINPEPTTISDHASWVYRTRATEALPPLIATA